MSTKLLQKHRARLHAKQNRRCLWCGVTTWEASEWTGKKGLKSGLIDRHFNLEGSKKQRKFQRRMLMATIEHLIDRAEGGGNCVDNLVVACFKCNTKRSSDAGSFEPHPEVLECFSDTERDRILTLVRRRLLVQG